jgi:hypothetical protein
MSRPNTQVRLCPASWHRASTTSVPFTEENLRAIVDTLQLPLEYLQAMSLNRGKLAYFPPSEGGQREGDHCATLIKHKLWHVLNAAVLILRSPSSAATSSANWLVALSWDRAQRYGQVIIVGIEDKEREKMLGALRESLFCLADPLHFLIIILRQIMESDYEGIKKHGVGFKDIERWMQKFSVQSSTSDTTDAILGMITKSVNTSSSVLSFHEMRLESCSRALKYIAAIQKHFDSAKGAQSIRTEPKTSTEIISHMQNDIEFLLLEVNMYQKVADRVLAVVSQDPFGVMPKLPELTSTSSKMSNILMHQDNHTNKVLAEASLEQAKAAKEDSSAMMILALLGTIFLPATFTSVS